MQTKKIVFAAIISLLLIGAGAVQAKQISANDYGMMPGFMYGMGSGGGSFRIADLDLDGTNEIIYVQYGTLVVTDSSGTVLFSKEIEGLDYSSLFGSRKSGVSGEMMGWPGGGGGHMGGGWDWEDMPMMGGGHMGGSFEVVNLDSDANPEIVVRGYDELIVLDHTGELQTTIPVPEVDVNFTFSRDARSAMGGGHGGGGNNSGILTEEFLQWLISVLQDLLNGLQ